MALLKKNKNVGSNIAGNIVVIGAGSWGTALANLIASNPKLKNNEVILCSNLKQEVDDLIKTGENTRCFPGIKLSKNLKFSHQPESYLRDASMVVFSVPSKAVREVAKSLEIPKETILVNTAKGVEPNTLKRMSEVLFEEQGGQDRITSLSGPSFAKEVIKNLPTAVCIASSSKETLDKCVDVFHYGNFRVYSSSDLVGVEFGGVLKNIIAIAAGMLDGAQMGLNARAGMITRGMLEIQELCVAMGAKKETVFGLSGLGDLILTATGDLSRNRTLGKRFGQGEKLEDILKSLGQVAEAATSTSEIVKLAKQQNLALPIIFEVDKVLKGERSVQESVKSLLSRKQSGEFPSTGNAK